MNESPAGGRVPADEPPPLLGTWRRVYWVVLTCLAVLIFTMWLFTRHYRPGA